MKKISIVVCALFLSICFFAEGKPKPEFGVLNNTKVDGYRPIWFDLGQKTEYGSKYSGAFGTYTMKHRPLAIYDSKTDRTYFVYGGTTEKDDAFGY